MKNLMFTFFILTSATLCAQLEINVSGTYILPNGDPAQEVIMYILPNADNDQLELLYSDVNGTFEYTFTTLDDAAGCFDIGYFDCNTQVGMETYCYEADNTEFEIEIEYCPLEDPFCESFIQTQINADNEMILTTLNAGIGPYTYLWSTGDTTAALSLPSDVEGEYCVSVTHGNGCVSETCINLSTTNDDIDCQSLIYELEYEGGIFLLAENHNPSVSYEWSTGATQAYIYPLTSGEYCVTVVDNNSCSSESCYTVELAEDQNPCFSFIYELNNDLNGGTLAVETFGQAPYTYAWSQQNSTDTLSTNATLMVLTEATYCVTITDSDDCTKESCYNYQTFSPCEVYIIQSPSIGQTTLYAYSTSTGNLSYEWSNGDTMRFITVTDTEEYCVTITDEFGCVDTGCTIPDINALPSCYTILDITYSDGSATISTTHAGEGDFSYLWDTGETTSAITVNMEGVMCVAVTDNATGCFYSVCTYVEGEFLNECGARASITSQQNDNTTVRADLYRFGEKIIGELTYEWETGETTESITVNTEGTYCVTVSDNEGCIADACVDVHIAGNDNGLPEDGVWVYFFDPLIDQGLEATIELYTMNDDSTMNLVTTLDENNFFGIPGIYSTDTTIAGPFIVLAKPVMSDVYAPTYAESAALWENANWYDGNDFAGLFLGIEIRALPIESLEGLGKINGIANASDLVDVENGDTVPNNDQLANANIMLMHSDVIVGQMYTHEDGSFTFDNLPYGTYTVLLEQVGKPTITIEVTLSEQNQNADITFGNTVTSTEDQIEELELNVYPNPTAFIITIEFPSDIDINGSVISMTDINGKIMTPNLTEMAFGYAMDLSTYPEGMYLLMVRTNTAIYQQKIIKL